MELNHINQFIDNSDSLSFIHIAFHTCDEEMAMAFIVFGIGFEIVVPTKNKE